MVNDRLSSNGNTIYAPKYKCTYGRVYLFLYRNRIKLASNELFTLAFYRPSQIFKYFNEWKSTIHTYLPNLNLANIEPVLV